MNTNIKILLGDDSAFMRKILIDILTEAGFSNFTEAGSGDEVIEKFNSEKPDLVLLDIIMPGKNGIDVLKEIGDKGKVIVISAIGQDQTVADAKSNGALDYIVKPFDSEDVLAKIKSVI